MSRPTSSSTPTSRPSCRWSRAIALWARSQLALLLALLRLRPECIAWVGDVVLHAITRGQPNTVLPHLTGPRPIGALTEGVPDPGAAGLYLALDELVADRGPFRYDLSDRVLEPIALGAHLGHVARARPPDRNARPAPCRSALSSISSELVRRSRSLGVGILLAPESPSRLGQCGELLGVSLAPVQKPERLAVEALDALQLPRAAAP